MIVLSYPCHSYYPVPSNSLSTPLSIFSVGTYLENKGVKVRYFDQRIQPMKEFKKFLAQDVKAVGISVKTSVQISYGLKLALAVKKYNPSIFVIFGGVFPTMCSQEIINNKLVDFVVKREGEESFYKLIKVLLSGSKNFSKIKGIVWKKNKIIIENPDRGFLDLNLLANPYQGQAKKMLLKYYMRSKTADDFVSVETSRGCMHNCGFCYNQFFHKNKVRLKKIPFIKKELIALKIAGVEKVSFVDDNLAVTKKRLYDICKMMQEINLGWSGSISLDFINNESLSILEKSNCFRLCIGLESFSQRILEKVCPRKEQFIRNKNKIRLLAKSKIDRFYSFIIGFPDEDETEVDNSIKAVREINNIDSKAEIALQPYTPYPGTSLYSDAVKKGFLPPLSLNGWGKMTMDNVDYPWIKKEKLFKNLYLASTLAFRYHRFFKGKPFLFILHKIAKLRFNYNFWLFPFEVWLYSAYKNINRLRIFFKYEI